jgi:uncharacterized protein (DUF1330 family)
MKERGVSEDRYADPHRAAFETFKALPRDEPIEMLNLVRLRKTAAYPADHPAAAEGLSGAAAYARYGAETTPILARVGGRVVWRAKMRLMLIGPDDEGWDLIFAVRYPTAGAFLAMVTDPEYRKAVVHRQAAVLTSRLFRCEPMEPGAAFG